MDVTTADRLKCGETGQESREWHQGEGSEIGNPANDLTRKTAGRVEITRKVMLRILDRKQLWRSQPFGSAKNARMQQYRNFVAS